MQKLLAMLATALVGAIGDYLKKNPELVDRAVDRLGDRLTEKLPDLSDLDDQIVAKLPDLSGLPEDISQALTAVLDGLFGKLNLPVVGDLGGVFKNILGIGSNKGIFGGPQ